MRIFNLIVIICITYAFTNIQGKLNGNYPKAATWNLEASKNLNFNVPSNGMFDYCKINGIKTLLCLEHTKLKYYNIESGNVYRTDSFDLPLDFTYQALRCLDQNTIIVSSGIPGKIILYDLKKKAQSIYDLPCDEKLAKVPPGPSLDKSGTFLLHNNRLYMAGLCVGESKNKKGDRPNGICLDLSSHKYSYFMDFPDIYYKYNWGELYYRIPFMTGDDLGRMIYSFPACHEIYLFNPKDKKVTSVPARSKLIADIKPFSYDQKIYQDPGNEKAMKYYFTSPSYSAIIYDKYRGFYYRMVDFPNPNYGDHNSYDKSCSIIIFDKSFNYLGETKLPKLVYNQHLLTTEDGLLIPYFNFQTLQFGFTLFKITKK
jgi:hypothetical protein